MVDLTKITTPYGLLDEATQKALKEHGGPYEYYGISGWTFVRNPEWHQTCTYHVKPQPPKPSAACLAMLKAWPGMEHQTPNKWSKSNPLVPPPTGDEP